MLDFVLLAAAREDLREILAYGIERHGRERAEKYLREIDRVIDRAREWPRLAPFYEGLKQPLRSFPCGRHRIFFKSEATEIIVVRVLHQAMDAERHL